jgi:hypothetical protein
MDGVIGTSVSAASITTAAGPLALIGIGLAVAFVVVPKVALKAIAFVRKVV